MPGDWGTGRSANSSRQRPWSWRRVPGGFLSWMWRRRRVGSWRAAAQRNRVMVFEHRAHGVVVSHPLRMRKALGSNPSGSNLRARWRIAPACEECEYRAGGTAQMCPNHAGHLSHGCACDGPSAWACHLQRLTAGASLLGAPSWARGLVVGSRALWLGVCVISVVQSAGL